jgi:capsular exopolysaccharide synthesis family protein
MAVSKDKGLVINSEFNPAILSTVIKRSWYWILLIFGIAVAVVFIFLRYSKPVYESSAVIQVVNEDPGADVIGIENINNRKSLSKEIQLLNSQYLFDKAIRSLNLNISYFSKGEFLTEERYLQSTFNITPYALLDSSLCNRPIFLGNDGNQLFLSYDHNGHNYKEKIVPNELFKNTFFELMLKVPHEEILFKELVKNQLYFEFNNVTNLVNRFLPDFKAEALNMEARTINLIHKSNNANLSRDIVQAVTNAFFGHDESLKRESSDKILGFIEVQLDSLRKELNASKDSIMAYQRREQLSSVDNLSSSLSAKLNELQDRLYGMEEDMKLLSNLASKIENSPNRLEIYKLIPELIGKSFEGSLSSHVKDLHDLLEKREDLMYSVTPENQVIKRIEQRIEVRVASINSIMETLNARLIEKSQSIKKSIVEVEFQYYGLPEKSMELSRLKNLQDLNQKYYTLFTEKKVLYSISNAGYTSQNMMLSRPTLSNIPISPKKNTIYGGAIFVSFILSLALIFFKYIRYNEITEVSDLESLLPSNVGMLGSIPLAKKSMDFSQLVVVDAPKSMIAEAMRSIRTNMAFVKKDARIVAVSSSVSGEGKTFVSINLAGIIALSGKKTVIIDLDLRKPKIHLGLFLENDLGMSNLLVGQCGIYDCAQKTSIEMLDVITAGPIPPNPSELILNKNFLKIVEELKEVYDVIVIDNPPVGLVSDGVQVLAMADVPIYVFKANYSKRHFVGRVKELVEVQGFNNLNVILNGVNPKQSRYGYGYGSGYGYGGYYEEDTNVKSIFGRNK